MEKVEGQIMISNFTYLVNNSPCILLHG